MLRTKENSTFKVKKEKKIMICIRVNASDTVLKCQTLSPTFKNRTQVNFVDKCSKTILLHLSTFLTASSMIDSQEN
jgi:dTDP-4-dehydrorhamnose 3,5-epimerase-like enzyme